MLYRTLFILTAFFYLQPCLAEGKPPLDLDNPKPLIMQDGYNMDDNYSNNEKPAFMRQGEQPGSDDITEHCAKLKSEYDSLKGKPQRRWALKERYKAECQAYFDLHQ